MEPRLVVHTDMTRASTNQSDEDPDSVAIDVYVDREKGSRAWLMHARAVAVEMSCNRARMDCSNELGLAAEGESAEDGHRCIAYAYLRSKLWARLCRVIRGWPGLLKQWHSILPE